MFPIGPLSCSEGFTELGYYNGSVSQTDSGSSCLKWTDFPDYMLQYPDRGLGDHNHCRNPDRASNPWCFFRQKSGAIGWAYCDCHQGEHSLLLVGFFFLNKSFILISFCTLRVRDHSCKKRKKDAGQWNVKKTCSWDWYF